MTPTISASEALAPTPMAENRFGLGLECAYRMDAYYYGFSPTGLDVIDRILCAVACAGKGYHHTEDWNDEASPREPFQRGTTQVEIIQNAALDSAATIRSAFTALIAERDALRSVLADFIEVAKDWEYDDGRFGLAIDRANELLALSEPAP